MIVFKSKQRGARMKKIIFRIAICVIAAAVLCAAAVLGMNVYMKNKVKNRIFLRRRRIIMERPTVLWFWAPRCMTTAR